MESSRLSESVQPGTEVEVISVTQDDLRMDIITQVPMIYAFNRTDGSHGHEDRGLNHPVVGGDGPAPRIRSGICLFQ